MSFSTAESTFGLGTKAVRRYVEQDLRLRVVLYIDRERGIRRCARRGADALRDLLLHHDRDILERAALHERGDRRGRDVVRQVRAGDRPALTELLATQRGKIEREHVALHDLEVVELRHGLRKDRQQRTVKLDRNNVLRAAAQCRQAAHARADLNNVPGLARAAHLRDALGNRDVGRKFWPSEKVEIRGGKKPHRIVSISHKFIAFSPIKYHCSIFPKKAGGFVPPAHFIFASNLRL